MVLFRIETKVGRKMFLARRMVVFGNQELGFHSLNPDLSGQRYGFYPEEHMFNQENQGLDDHARNTRFVNYSSKNWNDQIGVQLRRRVGN